MRSFHDDLLTRSFGFKTVTTTSCAFRAAAPKQWNNLQSFVESGCSDDVSKRWLRSHLLFRYCVTERTFHCFVFVVLWQATPCHTNRKMMLTVTWSLLIWPRPHRTTQSADSVPRRCIQSHCMPALGSALGLHVQTTFRLQWLQVSFIVWLLPVITGFLLLTCRLFFSRCRFLCLRRWPEECGFRLVCPCIHVCIPEHC